VFGFRNIKQSYEGEGDWLGIRTLFLTCPGLEEAPIGAYRHLEALYITVDDKVDFDQIISYVFDFYRQTTIEVFQEFCPLDNFLKLLESELTKTSRLIRFFYSVDTYFPLREFPGFVKVRVTKPAEMFPRLKVANDFAFDGHQVLLMPEYGGPDVGQHMMEIFGYVQSGVRVMPPVHHLLGID